jgi:glycosyltransferase involved in cell wall biosynthesis
MKFLLKGHSIPERDRLNIIRILREVGLYRKNVRFAGFSRSDVIQAFHHADLFLFPSHIECSPIVLFEAMASKTPFLITDVGNAREILSWTNGGDILPTIKDLNGRGM